MQQFNANVQQLVESRQQGQTIPSIVFAPSPYIDTSITFADLAPGQLVNITSLLDEGGSAVAQKIIVE